MNPRLRRLAADQAKLAPFFAGHPAVAVEPAGPAPPDRYRVVYDVPSLRLDADNRVVRAQPHVVTITLPPGYPREKPYCVVDQPVFHPNFGNYICIADFWSPSQSLPDVVVQIGDMLQYKLYNTRSPLNAVAARWAVEHVGSLPIGQVELLPPEPEIRLAPAGPAVAPSQAAEPTGDLR
jgi:hypothetical protein